MYIVLLHYIQPLEIVDAHVAEHREFLERHYELGHFVASGPQVPRSGGVIFAKNITRDELNEIIQEDPFFHEKIAAYEVIEFNPTKFGKGVEPIFI